MELRSLLTGFVAWAIYPIWLAAGGLDYLCHRKTDIEHTSGLTECWLHIAQFACIVIVVALAALAEITLAAWVVMLVAALAHSLLAFVDVSYTERRRRITPLEQTAHSFLEVLPLVAVALFALAYWPLERASSFAFPASRYDAGAIVLGVLLTLAGAPVLEEWWRTRRARDQRTHGAESSPDALLSGTSGLAHTAPASLSDKPQGPSL